MSSLEKGLFRPSIFFKYVFNIKLYEIFVYFEDQSLVHHFVCKDLLPFCGLSLLIVSFAVQSLLSLIRSHWFIFVFIFIILGGRTNMICCDFCQRSILPMFSSRSFIDLHLGL